jgi:acyl carrier protein
VFKRVKRILRSPSTAAVTDDRLADIRRLVVDAVRANPLAGIAERGAIERLIAGDDVTFDELGLDSLARLTLATDLGEHGFAISEVEVNEAGSIDGLTRVLLQMG